jgi:Cu-Zn family superoxide dismutase
MAAKTPKPVVVHLQDAKGQDAGIATLSAAATGVRIRLNVKNLPPGEHGLHIHQVAKCDPPDFKSAGAHLNPDSKQHGLENASGPHAGDMPNFMVKPDGTSNQAIIAPNVNMKGADDPHSIFTNGGTALVIHAKMDDQKTDPSGNSDLLDSLGFGVVADERFKDREHVAPILHDPVENAAQLRLALRLAVPFGQHFGRHGDVAPEVFRAVPAQEKPIKKGRLPLRKVEISRGFVGWIRLGFECVHG